jgi:hypothetical protein
MTTDYRPLDQAMEHQALLAPASAHGRFSVTLAVRKREERRKEAEAAAAKRAAADAGAP